MLPACHSSTHYYGSSRHGSAYRSERSSYHGSGVGHYSSDDPILAIVVVGLFAIPLIIEGIDELADWLW